MEKFKLSEQEISDIFSIPYWVTDKETALKFAIHIQYRLLQSKKLLYFMNKITNLSPEDDLKYLDIQVEYDEVYAREKQKL